jgi:hypothetical protein
MHQLIGKWQQPDGQPYPGLWFQFSADNTFVADFSDMGITSSGTYQVNGEFIEMDQTAHSFGIIGKFKGRFAIEANTLKMALGNPGEEAPVTLEKARLYLRK